MDRNNGQCHSRENPLFMYWHPNKLLIYSEWAMGCTEIGASFFQYSVYNLQSK